jgi:hypothetical protein
MKLCKIECYFLYPQRLSIDASYRCHRQGSCPAWCGNCRNTCKITNDYPWCEKFELKRAHSSPKKVKMETCANAPQA